MNAQIAKNQVEYLLQEKGYTQKEIAKKLRYKSTYPVYQAIQGCASPDFAKKLDQLIDNEIPRPSLSINYDQELESHFTGVDEDGNVTGSEVYAGPDKPSLHEFIVALISFFSALTILSLPLIMIVTAILGVWPLFFLSTIIVIVLFGILILDDVTRY